MRPVPSHPVSMICRLRRAALASAAIVLPALVASASPATAQVLGPCPPDGPTPGMQCGTVSVPEDRADPDSRRLDLKVVVAPAEGPDPAPDPLFILSGGPGQAATDIGPFLAQGRSPEMRRRDVVLVDQRGTGASNALACSTAGPPNAFLGAILGSDALLEGCLADVSSRADPRLYTTTRSAHDLDDVRRALGYDRIHLSGGSYGTRLALEYARRYPERTRAITLQGVAPVDFRSPLEYARFAQQALDRLFADCAADPDCSRAYPDLERMWRDVLARIRRAPAEVTIPADGGPVTARYSADDFAYTVRSMMYGPQALALPRMIDEVRRTGDFSPFAQVFVRRARQLWPQLAMGLHLSVFCAEDVPFIDDREIGPATDETFLGSWVVDEYRRGCDSWPRGEIPDDFLDPVRVDAPTLIISGRRDPSTPPLTGERVARHLPRSIHLIHPWGGHGFTGTADNSCEARARDDFLRTASVDSVDVSCAESEAPLPFEMPEREPSPEDVRAAIPVLTEAAPDVRGERFAYVRVDLGGPVPTSRIFVTRVGDWPGHPVGHGRQPRFGADGTLAWIGRAEGDESGEPRLIVADADGTVRLRAAVGDGVRDYAWSPDGSALAVSAATESGGTQLFLLPGHGGAPIQLTHLSGSVHVDGFGPGGALDWSPDGRHVAFALQRDPSFEGAYTTDLYQVDVASGQVLPLLQRAGLDMRPRWSPAGAQIAFATSSGGENRFGRHGLAVLEVQTGQVTELEGPDETFLEAPSDHVWLPDGTGLLAVRADGVASRLVRVTDRGVARVDDAEGPGTPPGTVARVQPGPQGRTVAFLRSDPATPWSLRAMDLPDGNERVIGVLEAGTWQPQWRPVEWTNAAGDLLSGILYHPWVPAGDPAPLVTWLHGGPDGRATAAFDPSVPFPTAAFDPLPLATLLERGYAVFLPNHRGSAGYAATLRTSIAGRYPEVVADDVLTGIDRLVDDGMADPERLLIGGWASGGLAVDMVLTRTDRFRAAVSGATNTALEAAYADGDFLIQWHGLLGGPPWNAREAWDDASPLRNAARIHTPLLLLHGDSDSFVPLAQSRYLATYLEGLGRPVRLDVLEGVGHCVVLPAQRGDVAERIVEWFSQWTRVEDGPDP